MTNEEIQLFNSIKKKHNPNSISIKPTNLPKIYLPKKEFSTYKIKQEKSFSVISATIFTSLQREF